MKKILNKVLEELKKDKPDLSYVRGMIEVIAEEEDKVIPFTHTTATPQWVTTPPTISGTPILNTDPTVQAEEEFKRMKNLPTI